MRGILILFYSLYSLLLICIWQHTFHLPWQIIPYHMAVILPIHILAETVIALITWRYERRWSVTVMVTLYTVSLSIFYALIFGSMHFWGDIITIRILGTYLHDFSRFLQSMPYDSHQLWAALLAFFLVHILALWFFSPAIRRDLTSFRSWLQRHLRPVLSVFLLLIVAFPALLTAKRIVHKAGEPLMVMLFDHMWGVTDNPLFGAHRIRVGGSDTRLRAAYAATPHRPFPKSVIVFIVDALRADHLSAYGYPRQTSPYLDSMIASGHAARVEHCASTCACTLCGVPSILLSRTWQDCAVNGFNLIGLLHDLGYPTYALVSGAHREWYNMAKFYSDDCTMYFDGKQSSQYYFKDDRVLLEGLDHVHPYSGQPSFFYFHLQSTHETGLLLDAYYRYTPFKRSLTAHDLSHQTAINEYDNKVLQADDIIRQVMQRLDKLGYLDHSIVAITSDHGQGLGEHGVSGHVDWLYEPQTSVPLIFIDDSLSLYHNLSFARQIDIAPTILARLGLPIPASWMGLPLTIDSVSTYSYHETGRTGLETGLAKYALLYHKDKMTYKYIFTSGFHQEELYNLIDDPAETTNLVKQNDTILRLLRQKAISEFQSKFSGR